MLPHDFNRVARLDRGWMNRMDLWIDDGKGPRRNLLFSDEEFHGTALRFRGDLHFDHFLIPTLNERRNAGEKHTVDLRRLKLSETLPDDGHRGPWHSGRWLQLDLGRGSSRPAAGPAQHQGHCNGNNIGLHRETGLKRYRPYS